MMKKGLIYIAIIAVTVTAVSCSKSKKDLIAKKWQAVSMSNPQMEQMITEQEAFLDTFGAKTPPALYDSLYGTSNIDSLRQSLKSQIKDYKAMQEHSLKTTWFEFNKNGIVIMNFSGQVDSTKWYFNDKDELILDEMQLKGAGEKITMVVEQLNDTALKLKFNDQGIASTITFHPDKK